LGRLGRVRSGGSLDVAPFSGCLGAQTFIDSGDSFDFLSWILGLGVRQWVSRTSRCLGVCVRVCSGSGSGSQGAVEAFFRGFRARGLGRRYPLPLRASAGQVGSGWGSGSATGSGAAATVSTPKEGAFPPRQPTHREHEASRGVKVERPTGRTTLTPRLASCWLCLGCRGGNDTDDLQLTDVLSHL
jgi:hypothetical protein